MRLALIIVGSWLLIACATLAFMASIKPAKGAMEPDEIIARLALGMDVPSLRRTIERRRRPACTRK